MQIRDPITGDIHFFPDPPTISIITDAGGMVIDLASRKENLSRGYQFTGHKVYEDVPIERVPDIQLGDQWNGLMLTPNAETRQEVRDRAINEAKVQAKIRQLAIADLKAKGELPQDFV